MNVLNWIKAMWKLGLGVIIILLIVILYLSLTHYSNNRLKLKASQEVATWFASSTNNTIINFSLKANGGFPAMFASLQTDSRSTKVTLKRSSVGNFFGNFVVPKEWLKKPQTITFGLYVNGLRTSKTVRIAVTDISLILPPDPGEAGKATLEGIDSDKDGVRDDLQREIVFMYPGNDEVRRVLRAMVKKEQDVITTTGDHEHFKGLILSAFEFENCYRYILFGTGLRDYTNEDILWDMLRNTSERKQKDEDHQYLATPYATVVGSVHACENIQGQY